jgi:glycosyltransferase involved in cell wall biosynthesis
MNLLFVTHRNVCPLIGGIERVTYSIVEALRDIYDIASYSLYTEEVQVEADFEEVFIRKERLQADDDVQQVVKYIAREGIDVIVVQGSVIRVNNLTPMLRKAANQCQIPLVFVFHQMPGAEFRPLDMGVLYHRLRYGTNKKSAIRQLLIQTLYRFAPCIAEKLVEKKYKMPYECADKMVVLSKGYIEQYNHFVGGEASRYVVVNNMLSFPECEENELKKQKEVLIVARMDERPKRIKTALKVWRRIDPQDWKLNIVGYGEDLEYYKHLASKWKLQNISFEGLQDPLPYYQRASIFLMTSAFEGWGLTITEAQQCGCVPIAFDSYSAVHDIIQSGRNGYIVPNNAIDEYVCVLKELMNNDTLRAELAANAQKDVLRFSRENIAKQWKTLLENL